MKKVARAAHGRKVTRILLIGVLCLVAALSVQVLSAPPAHAWTRGHDTIVLVHGFNGDSYGSSAGYDCNSWNDDSWGPVLDYLGYAHKINGQDLSWYRKDFRTISYYRGDTDCGGVGADYPGLYSPIKFTDGTTCSSACESLHNPAYTRHCSGYYPDGTNSGQDGTNNESLYHLSCLFAWYLSLNFQPSWNVEIVAHSMGGLIVRNTIYQVAKSKATWTMPSSLPNISDVVTFSTPHGGISLQNYVPAWWVTCNRCTQLNELYSGSSFMNEMYNSAQNPQWGGTDWTMMGSTCDGIVDSTSATYMSGGRKTNFNPAVAGSWNTVCYSHESILTDEQDSPWDATMKWCDGCSVNAPAWDWHLELNNQAHSLNHMMLALWLSTW